jgi:hypothetical protein
VKSLEQLRKRIKLERPFVGLILRQIAKNYGEVALTKALKDFKLNRNAYFMWLPIGKN